MITAAEQLRERWGRLWRGRPAPDCAPLLARYAESHRAYHNAEHIRACLGEYDRLGGGDDVLELAIWFHDAISDPRAPDNELQSAAWARDMLAEFVEEKDLQRIERLIRATEHKKPPADADEAAIIDIDLSILGQPAAVFDAYDAAIRREYAHVPEEQFRAGRLKVLRHFLDRPGVFSTEEFRQRYEATARDNLSRSIQRLNGGTVLTEVP